MRKCRNWQTSKTKDLVIIAIVWVQVPSSALKKERLKREIVWVFSFSEAGASLEPSVQGLRSASVGAKQTSTGRLAPHLPHFKKDLGRNA